MRFAKGSGPRSGMDDLREAQPNDPSLRRKINHPRGKTPVESKKRAGTKPCSDVLTYKPNSAGFYFADGGSGWTRRRTLSLPRLGPQVRAYGSSGRLLSLRRGTLTELDSVVIMEPDATLLLPRNCYRITQRVTRAAATGWTNEQDGACHRVVTSR